MIKFLGEGDCSVSKSSPRELWTPKTMINFGIYQPCTSSVSPSSKKVPPHPCQANSPAGGIKWRPWLKTPCIVTRTPVCAISHKSRWSDRCRNRHSEVPKSFKEEHTLNTSHPQARLRETRKCVCVLHIKQFFPSVDIQHNQCPCPFFNPRRSTRVRVPVQVMLVTKLRTAEMLHHC